MRKALIVTVLAGVLATATAGAALAAGGRGRGPGSTDRPGVGIAAEASPELAADLAFMREEEKLARDVYLALDEIWDARVFASIARSEQRHMDAVARLLDRFGIEDPAAVTAPGEFVDPELQALHDDLVARGAVSISEALAVGALIEEVDIDDLAAALARTDDAAVQRVFGRLLSGSENHLRAFVNALADAGIDYAPVVLDAADFTAIVG